MSEPSVPPPVPGPGPAVPGPARTAPDDPADRDSGEVRADRFADLRQRPVAEHVEAFAAEHARLRSELGTIDRL